MPLVERCPGLDPGPTMGRHSSLLGGTCKIPPLEDTIGTPHAQTSRPVRRMGPASVTQLAYSHLSINNSPPASRMGLSGGNIFFVPRIGFGDAPAGPFGVAAQHLSAGRNCVATVVEVIGLEPTTSCLQSRRSPS
jgi:hypothetical protein